MKKRSRASTIETPKATLMKVGILGSGVVAQSLALGFIKHGHEVMLGTTSPSKLKEFQDKNPKAKIGTFGETARFGQAVVLAVKGAAAEGIVGTVANDLAGKTVIDTTNPISTTEPPVNGAIRYFTSMNESLMERLQKIAPQANFVKCFNSVGNGFYVNPQFAGGPPTMFICGNNDGAKKEVKGILDQFGWETADMGKVESAGSIEALCILWCVPGLSGGSWTHAFKLLK
ncbi:MAG TPA: NAD(P)-binding domain-containing protein [Cyclobacteriaceae bacterium]|nr:NAD(P)-binding domain-containing protein [Cyclobacteriaceae bacterium]